MLPVAFFFVAAIYSAVGFGGGSTYIALLALSDQPAELIPLVALPCNILVVTLGSYFAVSRRDFDWRMAVPFFLSSVPMAFSRRHCSYRRQYLLLTFGLKPFACRSQLVCPAGA